MGRENYFHLDTIFTVQTFQYILSRIFYQDFSIDANGKICSTVAFEEGWPFMSGIIYKHSLRNENFNLLVRIKFLNLFLYTCSSKIKTKKFCRSNHSFTSLGTEDRCSLWELTVSRVPLWKSLIPFNKCSSPNHSCKF